MFYLKCARADFWLYTDAGQSFLGADDCENGPKPASPVAKRPRHVGEREPHKDPMPVAIRFGSRTPSCPGAPNPLLPTHNPPSKNGRVPRARTPHVRPLPGNHSLIRFH